MYSRFSPKKIGYIVIFPGILQGVKKVQRHYSIGYNFSNKSHSILELYMLQELLNIKVSTMLKLLKSYFTIIKLEVYTQGVKRGCRLLLIIHTEVLCIQLFFILFAY